MVYSRWLAPEPGPRQGLGPGRMGCMVLIRTFHPEQGQGKTLGTFLGPEEWVWYPFFRSWKCSWWWILLFFPVPVQVQCERFYIKLYNPFFPVQVQCERLCIIPFPVPDQASVNTPSRYHSRIRLEASSRKSWIRHYNLLNFAVKCYHSPNYVFIEGLSP